MALLHYIAELKCLTKESLEDVEITGSVQYT